MASEQEIKLANESIKLIMELLGIFRVVSVDDFYNKEINIEELVGLVCDENTSAMKLIPSLEKDDIQDTDVARKKIIKFLEGLDEAALTAINLQFVEIQNSQLSSDGQSEAEKMNTFCAMFSHVELCTLTLQEWDDRKIDLLRESTEDKKTTLFLFDREMGNKDDGIRLISELLANESNKNIICGLLTHTILPDELPEAKDILSEEFSISKENRDRFMVIPKLHLGDDPVLFAQIMKLLALSHDFSNLKKTAKKIYEDSLKQASDDIENISIYDLDHILFQSTKYEGLWEPDMLFRLFSLYQRLNARRLAYTTPDLETITQKLRIVSQIPAPKKEQFNSNVWRLQRLELYDQDMFINKNHLPIELGDIFQKANDKHYILLGQPCDLMVRNDGKRANKITHLTLAEIKLISNDKLAAMTKKQQSFIEELEYFDENSNRKWYVLLNRTHHVWACILDLCVFDSSGRAVLELNSAVPLELKPSWAKRFKEVNRHVINIKNNLGNKIVHANQWVDFITDPIFKAEYKKVKSKETVSFNCKRVTRLSKERAFGLLLAYTSVLGRPGYDKDFGIRD